MRIVDIQQMPGFNPSVKNGIDSVSTGSVTLEEPHYHTLTDALEANRKYYGIKAMERKVVVSGSEYITYIPVYPSCIRHGAMNKVSPDGIWRCLALGCNNGCYQLQ